MTMFPTHLRRLLSVCRSGLAGGERNERADKLAPKEVIASWRASRKVLGAEELESSPATQIKGRRH